MLENQVLEISKRYVLLRLDQSIGELETKVVHSFLNTCIVSATLKEFSRFIIKLLLLNFRYGLQFMPVEI